MLTPSSNPTSDQQKLLRMDDWMLVGGDYIHPRFVNSMALANLYLPKILTRNLRDPQGEKLTLLKKQPGPISINNFRPISVTEQVHRVIEMYTFIPV